VIEGRSRGAVIVDADNVGVNPFHIFQQHKGIVDRASARWFLSLIALVGYVLTKVSVTVYAGAVVFQTLMGVEFWTGALIIVIVTGIYTTLGGLRAVVYTDTLQSIVLVIGSLIITFVGLFKIGGWGNLVDIIGTAHFNMFLPADHPEFPVFCNLFIPGLCSCFNSGISIYSCTGLQKNRRFNLWYYRVRG
jgi:Na+/proline symporter